MIQTYVLTSTSKDDEVEEFYQNLVGALAQKSMYTIFMEYFKVKFRRG